LEEKLEEANVHWLMHSLIRDFEGYQKKPNVFINQIPNESILTHKDLLAETMKRIVDENGGGDNNKLFPDFCKPTFDLTLNFPEFMSYALRNKEGIKAWIIKPVNFSNAMGISISDDLSEIVRLREQSIPLIAQEYVSRPLLFKRSDLGDIKVKFDVRWMVWVSSVKPLKLYVSKIAWPRFGNKEWSMENFHEFEKHMSYQAADRGGEMLTYDWNKWDEDFCENTGSKMSWAEVRDETYKVIKKLLEEVVREDVPKGLGHYGRSRAHYGLDIIYEVKNDKVQPIILECNFNPDCTRIVKKAEGKYSYENYYNHMFDTLFIDDSLHKDYVEKLC